MEEKENNLLEEQVKSPVANSEDGTLNKKKEIGEETDPQVIVELLNKEVREAFSPKYQEELNRMAKEDPTSVMVETPEGWMTLAEALKEGFNPETGEFDGETVEEMIDRIIAEEGLSEEEGNRIRAIVLRKQEVPEESESPIGEEEEVPEGIEGEEMAMPDGEEEEEEPEEGVSPDILSMLGGK